MTRKELENILQADLGTGFDPQRALDFLRILEKDKGLTQEAQNLEELFENPPEEDTSLMIIYRTDYVLGEIVLAGKQTREQYPLTQYHPIHFKKTYLQKVSRWETSPSHEAAISHLVWKHFQNSSEKSPPSVPLPLGASPTTYRSEVLEARTLGALSPVSNTQDVGGMSTQIIQARKHFGPVKPLWCGLENLYRQCAHLHQGGFLHNDLHRENLLIRFDPLGENPTGCLIDFETTEEDPRFGTQSWEQACREDRRLLIEEAALIRLCAKAKEKLPFDTELSKEVEQALKSSPKLLAISREMKSLETSRPKLNMPAIG